LLSATGKTLKKIESTAVAQPEFLEDTLETKTFTLDHGEHLFGAKISTHKDKLVSIQFLLFRNLYPGKDEAPKNGILAAKSEMRK